MRISTYIRALLRNEKKFVLFLIGGYLLLTLLCFFILLLPFSRQQDVSLIDHIFFSVSIVSTTGLAPGNFNETYSFIGKLISLFFIQLGGVGYMALCSFILLRKHSYLPLISKKLLNLEFSLPQKYPQVAFIYSVFVFTLLIEIIGAVFLYVGFKDAGVANPLWNAVFHSVSAFCTAGFSLFNNSLVDFNTNSLITNTIVVLSLFGSIGFIVLSDFWLKLWRKRSKVTLTSKIILVATITFIVFPTLMMFVSDVNFFAQGADGIELSFFQVVSAHTTVGFNTYDLSSLKSTSVFILIIVMVIGASPAGTGGGIKTTSVTALYAVLVAILKRQKRIRFLSKQIPDTKVYLAVASSIFYTVILIVGVWIVLIFDGANFSLAQIVFECSSALSTVGLSTGITPELTPVSKIVISFLMFIGRLGVLTFGLALVSKVPVLNNKIETEDIAV